MKTHDLMRKREGHSSWAVEDGIILMGTRNDWGGTTSELAKWDGTTEEAFTLKYSTQ